MANELRLIDPEVVRQIQKICDHLNRIESRSFTILGFLPLTFGSMTNLLGWIATGNLLLQRLLL